MAKVLYERMNVVIELDDENTQEIEKFKDYGYEKVEKEKPTKKATKKGDKADENATPETAIAD